MPKLKTEKMPTAQGMEDAASAGSSLQGYAAINDPAEHEEIARLAYEYYLNRGGEDGSAEQDWYRAEQEVRRRKSL